MEHKEQSVTRNYNTHFEGGGGGLGQGKNSREGVEIAKPDMMPGQEKVLVTYSSERCVRLQE